jgi:hypothetical protein
VFSGREADGKRKEKRKREREKPISRETCQERRGKMGEKTLSVPNAFLFFYVHDRLLSC